MTRTIETQTNLSITVQPSPSRDTIVFLVIDGEVHPLTRDDAARLASALTEAANSMPHAPKRSA